MVANPIESSRRGFLHYKHFMLRCSKQRELRTVYVREPAVTG
jgi:hypothetical protein